MKDNRLERFGDWLVSALDKRIEFFGICIIPKKNLDIIVEKLDYYRKDAKRYLK